MRPPGWVLTCTYVLLLNSQQVSPHLISHFLSIKGVEINIQNSGRINTIPSQYRRISQSKTRKAELANHNSNNANNNSLALKHWYSRPRSFCAYIQQYDSILHILFFLFPTPAAKEYLDSDPAGRSGRPITTIKQGAEPPTFTGWFQAWDPKMWDTDPFDRIRIFFWTQKLQLLSLSLSLPLSLLLTCTALPICYCVSYLQSSSAKTGVKIWMAALRCSAFDSAAK